jgi:hypothetical protein
LSALSAGTTPRTQFGPTVQAELRDGIRDVELDCVEADAAPLGDLAVRQAVPDRVDHQPLGGLN